MEIFSSDPKNMKSSCYLPKKNNKKMPVRRFEPANYRYPFEGIKLQNRNSIFIYKLNILKKSYKNFYLRKIVADAKNVERFTILRVILAQGPC